ncbi:hypothetical protein DYL61_15995 [Pseudomonas nabeulensis]|uniref:Uncharacterized protein n=1 Tax=Pseudomonas nabeulensis TaxID=2293833 RepID=A0A4Z0B256_9PSED|nr:hypothetical protein [Pseudomonas nabeulensis]TFY93055.1 hypothetical protein DYL61_15995 [Pseudomonas nabeulensis]
MDDFPALALSWSGLDSDTPRAPVASPSTSYLNERQARRLEGDQALIAQLLEVLATSPGALLPSPAQPVKIAAHALLGQWGDAFCKAINQQDFLDWADAQPLDFNTLHIHTSTLKAKVNGQDKVYTLADTSGWWQHATPIIDISQLVDPSDLGMPYIGPRIDNTERTLPLNLTLAFYGYPIPTNRPLMQTILEELQTLQSFPGFDDNGCSKSKIHAELTQQQHDYQQLADSLGAYDESDTPFAGLAVYGTRVQLNSDSMLASAVKEAAQLLQALLSDNGPGADAAQTVYFDCQRQVLCAQAQDIRGEIKELVPNEPDERWDRLGQLADKAGTDIYPDQTLSIASVLQVYGIERPFSTQTIDALIQRLRDWPAPPVPVILTAARSFGELYRFRQYVGLLNDRHTIRTALTQVISGGELEGDTGLGMLISGDPDTLQATVEKPNAQLSMLTEAPAFQAICVKHGIDPDSHVLLSASAEIGARGLDGVWKSLTAPVLAHPELSDIAIHLTEVASKNGGQLRTIPDVNLSQALRLYNLSVPTTLSEARLTVQRLEVGHPMQWSQGHYWRALKPLLESQPAQWRLSETEQQRIVSITEDFQAGQNLSLIERLAQDIMAGKSVADVRAEADFLMVRLLKSPTSQELGETLSRHVRWHGRHASERTDRGSRNALILAALILNLGPHPDAHPTRIRFIDWHSSYYWGESIAFVRDQIEAGLSPLSPAASALAAHLLLCGKGPQLLVRNIRASTPYVSAQTWVLFRQYVAYMEKVMPGSSRQMTYSQIMYLAYLPPRGGWKTFLFSPEAARPILDWGLVNGVLSPQARYGTVSINLAFAALNQQRTQLATALEEFAVQVPSLRDTARNDLNTVYPHNPMLDARVLVWLPEGSPFYDAGRFHGLRIDHKFSFTDLHMAGCLDGTDTHWYSTDNAIRFNEMAKHFHLLSLINATFSQAFAQKLDRLQAAFVHSLQYWFSHLTLPQRQALEYGHVVFFSLSRHVTAPLTSTPDEQLGQFGLLVYVSFYSDHYCFEIFPKHLLIRLRRDLNYEQMMQVADKPARPSLIRFDWPAYVGGAHPAAISATPESSLILKKLDHELAEVADLPPINAEGERVPRSFDSPRSYALATVIVEHYLRTGFALREKAKLPLSLAEAASDEDPWTDFLDTVAPAAH